MSLSHPFLRGVEPGEPFDLNAYACTVMRIHHNRLRRLATESAARAVKVMRKASAREEVEEQERVSAEVAILEAMGDRLMSITALSKATGISKKYVTVLLCKLSKSGKLERVERGMYRKT
ncbi:MAG TPA: type IV toxin-antitoxin system AbiEi family antitoxin domain-containing protein [Verrucomicrobiota bacterium]|nr:type IV toxin-antitoxin system AbiEi family antitoxin domain-containing protein [Verrucomicrobiota bacterium]HNS68992.1 type IV toxin-antitoxin system AbiEi family antitoxin domain-containing protein [Verrucomicrobiota bacterium]